MNDWTSLAIPHAEGFSQPGGVVYGNGEAPDVQQLYPVLPVEGNKGGEKYPILLWLHGGGLTQDNLDLPPQELYDGNRVVIHVRYRLSPNWIFPAPLEDAAAAVAWVVAHADELGGDAKRIFLGGCSAGAYLAALTAMDPARLAPYKLSHRDLCGLLLITGQMTTHFQVKADLLYPGESLTPVIDEYAPIAHLKADLPPILSITGGRDTDMAGRAAENRWMTDLLRAMGHGAVENYVLEGCRHNGVLGSSGHLMCRFMERCPSTERSET